MTATQGARNARQVWREGRRRRAGIAAVDRAADGAIAAGGLVAVNAIASLGIGLPAGPSGAGLGAALLAAGLAWIARTGSHRRRTPQPAGHRAPVTRLGAPRTHAARLRTGRAA